MSDSFLAQDRRHYRRPIRASGQTMAIYMGKGRVLAVKHPSQDSLKRLYFSHLEEAERAYCDVMLEQGPDYPRRLPLGCGHVFSFSRFSSWNKFVLTRVTSWAVSVLVWVPWVITFAAFASKKHIFDFSSILHR